MALDFRQQSNYPIGLRNNNPGNLRPGNYKWQGQVGINKNFVVFENIVYGLRALGTDISNKYFRGLDTINKIISVYAPPIENDTQAYIRAVSKAVGIGANEKFSLTREMLKKLMRAILTHEIGAQYSPLIPDKEIEEGIEKMSPQLLLRIKGFSQPTQK